MILILESGEKKQVSYIAPLKLTNQTTFLPYVKWTIAGQIISISDLTIDEEESRKLLVADDTGAIYITIPEKSHLFQYVQTVEQDKTYLFENFYAKTSQIPGKSSPEMLVIPRVKEIVVDGFTEYSKSSITPVEFKFSKLGSEYIVNTVLRCPFCNSSQMQLFNDYDNSMECEPFYGCLECHGRLMPKFELVKPSKPTKQRMTSWQPRKIMGDLNHPLPTYLKKPDSIYHEVNALTMENLKAFCQFIDIRVEEPVPLEMLSNVERFQAVMARKYQAVLEHDDSDGDMMPKDLRNNLVHGVRLHWPSDKFNTFEESLVALKLYLENKKSK